MSPLSCVSASPLKCHILCLPLELQSLPGAVLSIVIKHTVARVAALRTKINTDSRRGRFPTKKRWRTSSELWSLAMIVTNVIIISTLPHHSPSSLKLKTHTQDNLCRAALSFNPAHIIIIIVMLQAFGRTLNRNPFMLKIHPQRSLARKSSP